MKYNYLVNVEEILGVKINRKDFKWSYGTVAPLSTKDEYEKCLIKIEIDVVKDKMVFQNLEKSENIGKYHYFLGEKNAQQIYYERSFFFGKKLKYSIKITDNKVKVIVGNSYYKHVKHRIMGLHSISYILTDITSGLLLQNGLATIHCSAVNSDNQTIVFFAPPNTGKTLTSIQLCKNNKFNYIAEDFAITDGETIYSVPWTSTFRYYDDINESIFDKISNKFKKVLPILELISFRKNKSIDKYIGMDRIKKVSKVTDVAILERGPQSITQDKEDGLRKLINLNKYEFNYHKAPAVVVFDYFNNNFSPDKMYLKEKEILKKLLDNTNYYCVMESNALNYATSILDKIKSKKNA